MYFPVTAEMTTVLITRCLQRDFAGPVGPHDRLPSLLPVGNGGAGRLFGPEPVAWMDGWPARARRRGIGLTPPRRAPGSALFAVLMTEGVFAG